MVIGGQLLQRPVACIIGIFVPETHGGKSLIDCGGNRSRSRCGSSSLYGSGGEAIPFCWYLRTTGMRLRMAGMSSEEGEKKEDPFCICPQKNVLAIFYSPKMMYLFLIVIQRPVVVVVGLYFQGIRCIHISRTYIKPS